MMKNKLVSLAFCLIAVIFLANPALAQSENPLTLSLSKDFGYGGFGIDIQGLFSMKVKGPDNLARVEFIIDDQIVNEVITPPFRYQFDTGNYSLGKHRLQAIGYTASGQKLESNILTREFVSSGQGFQGVINIVLPILGIVILAMALAWGIPTLFLGKKRKNLPAGAPRSYAPLGGAVCPKCARPFAIHLFGMNVIVGKLDRCPYCGRWSVVTRASPQALKAAEEAEMEAAELEAAQTGSPLASANGEAEKLYKDLENSRYLDS